MLVPDLIWETLIKQNPPSHFVLSQPILRRAYLRTHNIILLSQYHPQVGKSQRVILHQIWLVRNEVGNTGIETDQDLDDTLRMIWCEACDQLNVRFLEPLLQVTQENGRSIVESQERTILPVPINMDLPCIATCLLTFTLTNKLEITLDHLLKH